MISAGAARQGQGKGDHVAEDGIQVKVSSMGVDDLPCKAQPEAGAGHFSTARWIGPVEAVENLLTILLKDRNAGVRNGKLGSVVTE